MLSPRSSNKNELEAAVEATIAFLNKAPKPVLLGGPKLRVSKAYDAFVELVAACGYAFAVMESAKGMVPEHHPYFIGTYWGVASTAFCAQIVESADAYLFVGSVFNDYSTVGFSLPPIKTGKVVFVHPNRVVIANCANFGCVLMGDLLRMLAKKLKRNTSAYENHRKMYVSEGVSVKCEAGEPLKVHVLFQHRQRMLSHEIVVISEAGDSINNCQKLKLPEGCGMDTEPNIGVRIPIAVYFNRVVSWCNTRLCPTYSRQVRHEEELIEAIGMATGEKKDCLCFIEVMIDKHDTSKELSVWAISLFFQ
ncbi:hypothetical protein ACSBR2_032576 [Camellia fascicularis]